jgi:signal transduction histidine kinase
MASDRKLDSQAILDGLGEGILIFDSAGKLLHDNIAARAILGTDLNLIRSDGWSAASVLFNARQSNPDETLDAVRTKALESARPVRFHIYRSGEYVPCWASAVQGSAGEVHTMITIETTDWTALTDLIDRFRNEMKEAVESTQGHVDLIMQNLQNPKPNLTVEMLSKRLLGFAKLIATHMHRSQRMLDMFERLENIRTGKVREQVRASRRKIVLSDFMEDFVEVLDEVPLLDPETEAQDIRARLQTNIPPNLAVEGSPQHLTGILHDLLRNAIMYSMRATPVKITAQLVAPGQNVQIDVMDEGYGVREKEAERVFIPFQRSRQPQIIGEFGYGLSLYLCKHEVEVMNGRMWFKSEENVGSTFSFMLPVWREDSSSSSSEKSVQP